MKIVDEIPKKKVFDYEKPQIAPIEDFLKARVMGQEGAIKTLSKEIMHVLSGLKIAQDGPRGSVLMLGPSGVGKTVSANAVVELLLSKSKVPQDRRNPEDFLIKVNCAEFGDDAALWSLTGARPGYVGSKGTSGYKPPALSPETLRNATFELKDGQRVCVVLLDEIERADESVRDFLLSALSEGTAKTPQNEKIDFRNVVFLFTSNLGNREITAAKSQLAPGQTLGNDEAERIRRTALQAQFRSEDIGRMCGSAEAAVVYEPLGREVLETILGREFEIIEGDLEKQGIKVEFNLTKDARDALLEGGVSDDHGARALKRYIRAMIIQPLLHPSRDENKAALHDRKIYISCVPGTQEYQFRWAEARTFWQKLGDE
jgi:ATP-dependent Clp protease ATP-binding subunit ClpA